MTSFEKKAFIKKILWLILILLVISAVSITLVLLFSKNYTLVCWIDAIFFSGFLIFAFSWMMIISNAILFTVAIYGVRQFFTSHWSQMDKDIIEYRDSRRDVPRYIIVTSMIYGAVFMLVAMAIYYINYKKLFNFF